jgi:topoisomerase IA-like protein
MKIARARYLETGFQKLAAALGKHDGDTFDAAIERIKGGKKAPAKKTAAKKSESKKAPAKKTEASNG